MQPNYDECKLHDKEPPFQLPVVFEDDHFAVDRKVMKTYTAVLSGDIKAPDASSISASAAKQLGVSIENGARSEWQLIDEELE
ncbi:hypothetical protein THAOC_19038, partial [Thalassiosira oceanica]